MRRCTYYVVHRSNIIFGMSRLRFLSVSRPNLAVTSEWNSDHRAQNNGYSNYSCNIQSFVSDDEN